MAFALFWLNIIFYMNNWLFMSQCNGQIFLLLYIEKSIDLSDVDV